MSNQIDYKTFWMIPIAKLECHSEEELNFVNNMSVELTNDMRDDLINITRQTILYELNKRTKKDLRIQILIRDQIINNMIQNTYNLNWNIAKESYELMQPKKNDIDINIIT